MVERRSRATTGTTQKENGARSDGAKRRSVGRQTMARTGEPRRSKRAQRDAKPGAKRSSEPLWARVLSCSRHFETMPYFEPHFMPPLRGSHLFLGGGSRGSAPCGAPPPGYFIPPLRGSEFRSLALAIYSSTSDLSRSRVAKTRRGMPLRA